VNDALLLAVLTRNPSKGLIWHTDRGSQYAADSHRALLGEYGIIQSMSRKGNCWDNAVAESFFHTLKTGLVSHKQYRTRKEAQEDIFEYIEVFYHRQRLHSTNDYWSPVDYENKRKVGVLDKKFDRPWPNFTPFTDNLLCLGRPRHSCYSLL